ncbi:MAG: hypothetical protein WAN35_00115 [Terracidiphilus sp.]
MKRVAALLALLFACAILLRAQTNESDGKAWLEANATPPVINVTGIWDAGDWGTVTLTQNKGGRRVIGTADSWDVTGVVSGTTVYLVIWKKDKVAFTAKLTLDGSSQLAGVYAKGILTPASKTVPMQLKK